jgi:hypothetical protein
MTMARSGQLAAPSLAAACSSAGTSPEISGTMVETASSPRIVNTCGAARAHIVWPWQRASSMWTLIPYNPPLLSFADGPPQGQVVGPEGAGRVKADVRPGKQLVVRHAPVDLLEGNLQFNAG